MNHEQEGREGVIRQQSGAQGKELTAAIHIIVWVPRIAGWRPLIFAGLKRPL
jgi:hypothetical protein